jgi:radical SAM superfamily enzyme YgiQ (UPF0313 family)
MEANGADFTFINVIANFEARRRDDIDRMIPTGPLYVTAALEQRGYRVDFRDYQLYCLDDPLEPANLVRFIENPADVIGISCASDSLPLVILAMKELKRNHPGKTIILGGIGATGAADEIIRNFPFIDVVVKGEGEHTIVDVMEHLGSGLAPVAGISFRDKTGVHINPLRERIRDLDALPFPSYHKLRFDDYTYIGMVSSRGCPFRCTFCDAEGFWGRQYVSRSPESMIEEIKLLLDRYRLKLDDYQHKKFLLFYDETFVVDRRRVLSFCQRLKEENIRVEWLCMGRIDLMDEELMQQMAAAGCVEIFYGVESGSDKILNMIRKGLKRSQVEQVVKQSLRYFGVTAFFIWGFPFETMEDFQETLSLISRLTDMGAYPVVYALSPLPISTLYKQYKDRLVFSEEYFSRSHLLKHQEMISLIKQYPDIFPGYYSWNPKLLLEKYEIAKKHEFCAPYLP